MKKFIKNVLIYSVCLIVLLALINYVFTVVLHYTNVDANIEPFLSMPEEIEICNLGSSHGMNGFCYDDYADDYVCFNFGLPSQSLLYDYRLLYNYRGHLKEGAVVFIPISYFSFYGLPEECAEDFEAKNCRYYKILPANMITHFDLETAIMERYMPILTAYEGLLTVVGEKNENQDESTIDEYEGMKTAAGMDIEGYASAAYNRHMVVNMIDENGLRIRNEENIEALYNIINLCYELNCRPILITTPFLKEYTQQVDDNNPEFWAEFYGEIEEIQNETGVEYYDFAFDARFSDAYSLFMNADHLNHDGAKKFTNILMEEVVGITQ